MRRADQQTPQVRVAGLRDPQLGVPLAGLVLSGAKTEIGSDGTAALESLRILHGQNVAQCRQRSDTRDLAEKSCFRVALGGQTLDSSLEPLDLQGQGRDRVEHRRQCRLQLVRKVLTHPPVKVRCRATR